MQRRQLVNYLNELLLAPCACEDVSNNGLQIEGGEDVAKVVFGVDACQALFDRAVEAGADFIMVHHGLSWGGGFRTFTGITAKRFGTLFRNNLSLYAAHLPLDAHPEVGNNAVLARLLGLADIASFAPYGGADIGFMGRLPTPLTRSDFASLVGEKLGVETLVVPAGKEMIGTVGIVSGGGSGCLGDAAAAGVDCLFTGEFKHEKFHEARELQTNVVAAGHYATETYGVCAVMDKLTEIFPELDYEFIDIPTGF